MDTQLVVAPEDSRLSGGLSFKHAKKFAKIKSENSDPSSKNIQSSHNIHRAKISSITSNLII